MAAVALEAESMLSEKQRTALGRQTWADLLWLMLPGTAWQSRILPADQPELGVLRRQLLLLAGTGLVLVATVFWVSGRGQPLAPPTAPEASLAPDPAPEPAPAVALPPPLIDAAPELPPSSPPEIPEASLAEMRMQPTLFSTAKGTAVYEGHDVRGVRVDRVGAGSFWDIVGVRSGDVVVAYNGVRIDTATAMLALLNSLEQDSVIRLRVRGDDEEERTLYYSAPR